MASRLLEWTVKFVSKSASQAVIRGRPAFAKFATYAKVEMRPPKLADVAVARAEVLRLIDAAKSGKWRSTTVREAFLNTVVTLEVVAWFFIGEVIGRRSLIGYSRVPGCYRKSPA
ncbi:unnamed protein product [Calicophoron daubneyi]|uniref:ATP synthase subunit n=1 Tax=Calicophoron daubneyi TaxID=300641 RepID=A0AAV2T8R9_CALDB